MVSTFIMVMPFKKLKLSGLDGELAEASAALVNLRKTLRTRGLISDTLSDSLRHESYALNTSKRVTA